MAFVQWRAEASADRCSQCGTSRDDWRDPATGRYWEHTVFGAARLEVFIEDCEGCRRVGEAVEKLGDKERNWKHPVIRPKVHPPATAGP